MPWIPRGASRRVSRPLPRPDAPPDVRSGRRVLLLRTFKDPRADIVVLTALAAALEAQDRIVLVGDGQDKAAICDGWQRVLGPEPAFDRQVSYVRSSEENWRATVLREICVADAIVLHLSPKDLAFPPLSRPPDLRAQFPPGALGERFRAFTETPLGQFPTGIGLLHEIVYLTWLNKVEQTVWVTENRYYRQVSERIGQAMTGLGDVFTARGQPLSPRMTALEQHLAYLKDIPGLPFPGPDEFRSRAKRFTAALDAELTRLSRTYPPMPPEVRERAVASLPLGRSDHPRRLPPDGKPKVIRYTAVEKLVFIPTFDIVEISLDDARTVLSAEAADAGCPMCGAPLSNVFFYVTGLHYQGIHGREALRNAYPRGKCQSCGRTHDLG